jgi:hypothetical protein
LSPFTTLPVESDPEGIEDALYESLAEAFPGWTPAEGNLEVWIARWVAQAVPDLAELAADSADEVFHQFGAVILGLPPHEATAATAPATWTTIDDSGYTIPEGTQIEVAISGDETVAFASLGDIVVPPGATTADGEVAALVEGAAANGVGGPASPVTALAYLEAVELTAPASGGLDGEDPEDYRERLAAELRLLSPRPILAADAAVLARRVPGVGRAVALDGYDPDTDTWENERMTTVAVVGADGEPVADGVKEAVLALLSGLRELNFIFHVIDPTYTTVDVAVEVSQQPGYDTTGFAEAVEETLTYALSPALWGTTRPAGDAVQWANAPTVRRNDLIAIVDRVDGVQTVVSLKLAEGGGTPADADLDLAGPAPLPRPGAISATVV